MSDVAPMTIIFWWWMRYDTDTNTLVQCAEKNSLLQSKFSMLKSVVENGKISIALHGIRMIQSKLSLIYIQGLLLVNSSLCGHKTGSHKLKVISII